MIENRTNSEQSSITLTLPPLPDGAVGWNLYRVHPGWTERRILRRPWWARWWPWYPERYAMIEHPETYERIYPIERTEEGAHGAVSEETGDH